MTWSRVQVLFLSNLRLSSLSFITVLELVETCERTHGITDFYSIPLLQKQIVNATSFRCENKMMTKYIDKMTIRRQDWYPIGSNHVHIVWLYQHGVVMHGRASGYRKPTTNIVNSHSRNARVSYLCDQKMLYRLCLQIKILILVSKPAAYLEVLRKNPSRTRDWIASHIPCKTDWESIAHIQRGLENCF